MSKRERLRISFNMDNPAHAAVWNEIHRHSGKQRSEFVIACVRQVSDHTNLIAALEHVLDERLAELSTETAREPERSERASLPQALRDFADHF